MKRVLIVDDEEDMLWMLQRNLSKALPHIEFLVADSGEQALNCLSTKNAQLVVSDINMPGMNGLDLLLEINNSYPTTSVIIMTAYPTDAYKNEAIMSGCLRFIEKPFDVKDLKETITNVLEQDEQFQGSIGGINLIDIVQFNGLSGASAALKVTTAGQEGIIFFKDGRVVHAICDNSTGEEAFFAILKFHDGTLQNIRGAEAPSTSITTDLQTLLLRATVNNDEATEKDHDDNILEPIASLSNPPDPNPPPQKEEPEMNTTEIQRILAEFTGIEGVHTACLVGRDGFLLDSIARPGIDTEMIGAIASSGFGSAESMGGQLGQGELNMTMFEYENGPVMFAPVGSEAFLVIVADQETNLGWIRISIKKNSKRIQQAAAL